MKLYTIDTGFFKLDGGAMFGVVPKTMWQKLNPPDENNMCTWAMRCLLIQDKNRLMLVDTGMGDFIDDIYKKRYHPFGEETLEKSLAKHGFSPTDITDVFLTHLHFDHCIGALKNDGNHQPTLRFPN
ncbi:MAG TPA: MBL fold metallo-hydrolase, partial [Chitinophagales bacterium]|nr:MBL fold metallo-hydrolase [Chitinophagales bacterium]